MQHVGSSERKEAPAALGVDRAFALHGCISDNILYPPCPSYLTPILTTQSFKALREIPVQ